MIYTSTISIFLFLFLCYFLLRSCSFDRLTFLALSLKIIAGIGLGLIYKFYYLGGDTFQYYNEASKIAEYLQKHPAQIFRVFFNSNEIPELSELLMYGEQPRALFFATIVSVFYILTGGSYWLISLYFSLIGFTGIFYLVNELKNSFSDVSTAAIYAFYFLPTFVFWSSGLLKESIAVACMCIATSIALKLVRTSNYGKVEQWILLMLSFWLLWKLKYYYAATTFPLLAAMVIYHVPGKNEKWRPLIMVSTFLGFAFVISGLHYNLNLSRLLSVIYENYQISVKSATGNYIQYYHFDGREIGFLLNIPIAFFSGLFRPMIWETNNLFQVFVAMENALVFIILLVAFWQSKMKLRIKNRSIVAITLLYVFSLATLLAFATPNFGTLSRYKVGYWPFFVFMVMAFFLKQQKGRIRKETGLNK